MASRYNYVSNLPPPPQRENIMKRPVLVAAYFIHYGWPVPEAVITAVRAPDDGC